jgi:hypothetical protein
MAEINLKKFLTIHVSLVKDSQTTDNAAVGALSDLNSAAVNAIGHGRRFFEASGLPRRAKKKR